MTGIPAFDKDKSYVFSVSVTVPLEVFFDHEPTPDEVKAGLLDEFLDYFNQIPDMDLEELSRLVVTATLIETRDEL